MSKLVIVESPTKAKTISKFLGKDYKVLSSFGHVRDLPKSTMGVDVAHGFEAEYEVPARSKPHVTELKKAAKAADEVLLATDEDREGEAIAWHIAALLKLDPKTTKRIAFHEITKRAIESALEHPRTLDMNLVNSQQTRRILDRLVGYELSPLLWQVVRRGLSAGRVQSVALRLIVERERERNAFVTEEYWTIDAEFSKDKQSFEAKLHSMEGKKLEKLDIKDEASAKKILADLDGASYTVSKIEKKQAKKSAPAPFTTSTLQIEANNKLGYSAKQTMRLAQKLYETGRITYMRTDSTNLSEQFLQETQEFIQAQFGKDYATGKRVYKTNKKGAQEAHEAIRPTHPATLTESVTGVTPQEKKLYDLIWSRAIASQLPDALLNRESVDIEAKQYAFRATGSSIAFDGYMKVYKSAKEKILPVLAEGDTVDREQITPNQHFTEPPARYSDATLVKVLEEHEIGRPSTYAPTISTILDREYVERDDNKKLKPTDTGLIVTDMLVEHFPDIVDYAFTSKLEAELDDIGEGKREWVPTLQDFYTPFHKRIQEKAKSLKREDIMKEIALGTDPKTGLEVIVRTGRFGPYLQLGKLTEEEAEKKTKLKTISIPKDMSMETITLEQALKLLSLPRTVGTMEDGTEILANIGRFGPYLKADKKTASLGEDYNPLTIEEADARRLITEAAELKKKQAEPLAELGEDPETKQPILIKTGRFGPYVTDGITNASVSKKLDPMEVTREQAIEMLIKKRARNIAMGKGPKAPKVQKKKTAKKK